MSDFSDTKRVGDLPHVRGNAEQEMENNELVGSTIVEPFVNGSSFPNRVKVHSNGVGAGNNGARNDVVSVQERPGYWFANSINVDCVETEFVSSCFRE